MADASVDRASAIAAIRASLRQRSGKPWSVRGGRGTTWGWITISAPSARMVGYRMSAEDSIELGNLLDLLNPPYQQVAVPASSAHYREYMNRAAGLPYSVAQQYWD